MKLVIGTPVFPPLVGGMETMAVNLATHFTARGLDVHVVTRTPSDQPDHYPFRVSRGLARRDIQKAVADCDLVLSNGAGLYIAPHAILAPKPLIFRHTNYQVSAVDGAGFIYGEVAPLRPWASIRYHLGKRASLRRVLRDGPKMLLTRWIAKYFVAANVAISDWMAMRQPLPRQTRIYNPFPITRFKSLRSAETLDFAYDFVYLGRLTAEKGVDTLLRAFTMLSRKSTGARLLIIGDGAFGPQLRLLAQELGIEEAVNFTGSLSGEGLRDAVGSARIAVVPSRWEEPFGGVTTELLASGKPMIVSRDGALAEIVGQAGLTFPNGDHDALAGLMHRVLTDASLSAELQAANPAELIRFDEDALIQQYLDLFEKVVAEHKDSRN